MTVRKSDFLVLTKLGDATLLFTLIALVAGLIIVHEVPLFWGLDESAHFSRAYQVSEGQFLPQKLPDGNYGGSLPASVPAARNAVDIDVTRLSSANLSQDN